MKYRAIFNLKAPSAERETPINALFIFGAGRRVKLGTGLKIHPKNWNPDRQRAKRGVIYELLINRQLDAIALALATIYMDLLNAGVSPTPADMRSRFRALNVTAGAPVDLF